MNITIGSSSKEAASATGTVVIIDVFRAFTTAAIALKNGAKQIIMVGDLNTALALREENFGSICMGERHGVKPEGFDFGNSPAEILDVDFTARTVIQTTSNGTRGILAAAQASTIFAGSLCTAEATIEAIQNSSTPEVALVAMGNGNERADEDELCALYLRSRLLGLQPDKQALINLIRTMSPRQDFATLSRKDLDRCLAIDEMPFAIPVVRQQNYWVATTLN